MRLTSLANSVMGRGAMALTSEMYREMKKAFVSEGKNTLALNACSRVDPLDVCISRSGIEDLTHVFTHKVEHEGKPMTNQKSSGRCWIFALFNAVRVPFMKAYNIDEFEFSQSHLFFYDKIERANYFLNNVVETYRRGEKVDGRLVSYLLRDPTCDGGQWDMLVNLVLKHGMMPKKNFPESFSSESSMRLNAILKSKLREFCRDIREHLDKGGENPEELIRQQMDVVYRIVGICLGVPKAEFVWEYYDKTKVHHKIGPITPVAFYEEYVKPHFDLQNKVCLVHDPRPSNQFGMAYTVDCLGNVVGGQRTIYNNQPIEVLLNATAESIKIGEPVWFGCEVMKRCAIKHGFQDLSIHDYKSVFGEEVVLGMNKGDRLFYGESCMSHAMVFTAASLDENGAVTKLRVENSWGDDRGERGFLLMTAEWFNEFVFEVVVDKAHLSQEVLDVFNLEPAVLPAWDPMGALACKDCTSTSMSEI